MSDAADPLYDPNTQTLIPILNKIPIVSFFFERKGQYVSNRKLLILLKAEIVIPQEHEPTPAQLAPTTKTAPRNTGY